MTTAGPLPRLVATDLDGTLLTSGGTVSDRTRRALAAAEAAGVEVVFVTARPPRWLDTLSRYVGGHGRVICLGGAAVWDLDGGSALEVHGFAADDVQDLIKALRQAVPGVALAVELVSGPFFDPAFPEGEPDLPAGLRARPVEDALAAAGAGTVTKLLAVRPDTPAQGFGVVQQGHVEDAAQDAFFHQVRSAVTGRAELHYSGAAGLAELLAPGVTKDVALARWCDRLDIDARDVWAFGDMPNDLPMLRWAGRGHAVANAHPDVLACADAVVGANDRDGVAAALEQALRSARAPLAGLSGPSAATAPQSSVVPPA
ncbi:Cof-type HAD-IIB family hydrolase [Isoptericola sp. NEAU-Y5]|uniref:Cof-type HAD-IIB family hydrolase n=1 Tax=Isoptericola luteus TaxID=2879484 RepID=A0ABS7ZE21_9MICO|nr:HAD family hydrolase [Isoptericola sp. NEAU-Y5]MCA5892717.1 Cof-type HAD-IIB family hydrolase [Isoptericola sp. NEAU-Y5]